MSLVCLGLVAGCGDNAARTLTRIAIDPGAPKVPAGIAIDLAATYVAADQSTSVADDVLWQVSDTGIAKVTPETGGHAKLLGVMTGTTMLNVAGTRGVAETFVVTVTPALLTTISISPPQPSIAAGTSTNLIATGTYSDSSNMDLTTVVAWSSSVDGVATVSDVGKLAGVAPGATTITASFEAVTGTVDAAVTDAALQEIQVTPIDPKVPKGKATQFTATGVFSDSSHQDITHDNGVVWSSDADAIASVDPATGAATLHLAGPATITATKDGISGSSHLNVTAAELVSITIGPPTPSAPVGLTLQLTATGNFSDGPQDLTTEVAWSSDHGDIASVDPDTGEVTAHKVGTATITATSKAKPEISASVDFAVKDAVVQAIVVSSDLLTIAPGTRTQFKAAAMLSDGTTIPDVTAQATWDSDNKDVATIANATTDDSAIGEARGIAGGDAQISAAFGGKTGAATLHVTAAVLQSIAVTAPTQTDQAHLSIAAGRTLQFQAEGTFVDATDPANPVTTTQDLTGQVTWDASPTAVAGISNVRGENGRATAVAEGTATITAAFPAQPDPIHGEATLNVTPAEVVSIAIDPLAASVPVGHHQQFTATATLTDGHTRDVTTQVRWSSSNVDVAMIDSATGDATAEGTGDATIGATFHQGDVDIPALDAALQVTEAVVESIAIDQQNVTLSIPLHATQVFTATARLSDGSPRPLTSGVVWTCDNTEVATIDPDSGLATAVAASADGVQITATFRDLTAHATLGVTADFVVIAATPANGATDVSQDQQIAVTFSRPINPATLTVQPANGDCTGSLQLSPSPEFTSCLGFASDSPTVSLDRTVATAKPLDPFEVGATLHVRVTTKVTDEADSPLAAQFDQIDGFTVVTATAHAPAARR
jgi:uncharacterized protein YjdB